MYVTCPESAGYSAPVDLSDATLSPNVQRFVQQSRTHSSMVSRDPSSPPISVMAGNYVPLWRLSVQSVCWVNFDPWPPTLQWQWWTERGVMTIRQPRHVNHVHSLHHRHIWHTDDGQMDRTGNLQGGSRRSLYVTRWSSRHIQLWYSSTSLDYTYLKPPLELLHIDSPASRSTLLANNVINNIHQP
jgi:hypothetical protein